MTRGSPGKFNNAIILSIEEQPITLHHSYPNPVSGVATLSYSLSSRENVVLKIVDMQGREIQTLAKGYQEPGDHQLNYDFSSLNEGIYLVVIYARKKLETSKILVMHQL